MALAPAGEPGMAGNALSLLDNPDLGGTALHLHLSLAVGVRHRVQVAVDGHHAVLGYPALDGQHVRKRAGRQRLQGRALRVERGLHRLAGGGVGAPVGDLVTPLVKLPVQIFQVLEPAGQEEVLAHVAERALHLALGLGPVGPAGPGMEPVVRGQGQQGGMVDDLTGLGLAQHRGLHAVIQQPGRDPAQLGKGRLVAGHQHVQRLAPDKTPEQVTGMAQHQGKQRDHPDAPGVVPEAHLEMGKVHLPLVTGGRLKAHLITGFPRRPEGTQVIGQDGVAALIPLRRNLPQQP